jgi:hypothetical protein
METKKCNKCNEVKNLDQFYTRDGKPRLPCKACNAKATTAFKATAKPKAPDLEGTKACSRCNIEKPKTEFYIYKISGNPWGYCIACVKVEHREYYEANTEELTETIKAWRAANPEKVKAYQDKWLRENPEKRKEVANAYYHRNSEQVGKTSRAWALANPDQAAFNRASSRYGMTREQWDALPAHCEICGKTEGKFAVDHDHDTGAIRGKVCNGCNTALAYFDEGSKSFRGRRDDIFISARTYMERHYGPELWS